MKIQKIFIPILGTLAILSGAMTTQAIVDPQYRQNLQTVETPEDTTIGESVTSTTPSVVDQGTSNSSPEPSPPPSPSPSPNPNPRPSANIITDKDNDKDEVSDDEKVLGVSTEKDHSEDYYKELKAQLLTLKQDQQSLNAEQKKLIYLKADSSAQTLLLLISLGLAITALLTEWRYQRMLKFSPAKQQKRVRKLRRK